MHVAAAALPLAVLVLLDAGLHLAGWVPPDDPLLRYVASFEPGFSPFVETPDGRVAVRPEWIDDGVYEREAAPLGARITHFYPGFRQATFAKDKPLRELRVFALGGSTTFGLRVGADEAFAAVLGRRLAEAAPRNTVEAVNLGCPGWASDRVLNLIPVLLTYEPDLIVVYCGHNELLGGGAAAGPNLDAARRVRYAALRASALVRWAARARVGWAGDVTVTQENEEQAYLREGRLPAALIEEAAVQRFSDNVRQMAQVCHSAGVPILFVLPAANLSNFPPISRHVGGAVDAARFDALSAEAQRRLTGGEAAAALEALDRAAELSPHYALVHFARGKVLEALGRPAEARAAYQRACDLDVYAHRITSRLEAALIAAAESSGAPWVDLRDIFHGSADGPAAAPVEALFLDHCHPTVTGHRLIAERLLPAARAPLGLDG